MDRVVDVRGEPHMHDPKHPQQIDERGTWVEHTPTQKKPATPEKLTGVLRAECLEKAEPGSFQKFESWKQGIIDSGVPLCDLRILFSSRLATARQLELERRPDGHTHSHHST